MKKIETSLYHRLLMPEHPAPGPHPLLILLHGRGADEEDLIGLVPLLDERLLVVSARAPFPYELSSGYTWYDAGIVGSPDARMFRESCELLHTFVHDVIKGYPVDPKRVFLLGFSMGTVMALAISLTEPELFRGVSANSGYLAEATHLTYRWDALGKTEFFLTHGTLDPVIPVQLARRAQHQFEAAHARMIYKEYPIGHQFADDELTDIGKWLTGLL